jgi:microcystin-dependent protein
MSEPFLGEIKIIAWNFAPRGWAFCNGQLLPINQNQALFAILGTTYGGNGTTTFALPNLQGRVPVHVGEGIVLGELAGEQSHTLMSAEMPAHSHLLMADAQTPATSNTDTPASNTVLGQTAGVTNPGGQAYSVQMYNTPQSATMLAAQAIGSVGGSQPHQNLQPYLTLNFIIALQGIFPSQN